MDLEYNGKEHRFTISFEDALKLVTTNNLYSMSENPIEKIEKDFVDVATKEVEDKWGLESYYDDYR